MHTLNAVATPALGYRCRECGHVSEPAPGHPADSPRDSRCAGCGLSIAEPRDSGQVERYFEPLIWWDALAA
jgi:hypothetical protein